MPLYEYECPQDGRFELVRKFSDPPLKKCPTCGKPVQKLASAPAIQFKGSGWYITDYARKSSDGGKDSGKEGAQESGKAKESSPDSGKGESSSDGTSTKPTTSKASSG